MRVPQGLQQYEVGGYGESRLTVVTSVPRSLNCATSGSSACRLLRREPRKPQHHGRFEHVRE